MPNKPEPPQLVSITIKPLKPDGDDPLFWVHLRKFLKVILRSYHLKATDMRIVAEDAADAKPERPQGVP